MTTLQLKNQRGSLVGPLATTDARYNDERADAIGAALWDIQSSLQGLLDPADLASIKATLAKYGSPSATTTQSGITSGDSARDQQGDMRARQRAKNLEQQAHTAAINAQNRAFWDRVTHEASIRR